jgi:branched-chain amino acid transport system ATP-binding protein
VLVIRDLHVAYGAIEALRGVTLEVPAGVVVALVGANGAGKSTLLNTISGLLKPLRGSILFDGEEIGGWRADRMVARGLVQVPEGRQVLAPLTVEENLRLGAYSRTDATSDELSEIYARFPALAARRRQPAGLLSGGEQQMLALGRALLARPRLLMMDEPSLGLAPLVTKEVYAIVDDLRSQGATILLVEQNARQALRVAAYAYVLEGGSITREGPAVELQTDPAIVDAYLGKRSGLRTED